MRYGDVYDRVRGGWLRGPAQVGYDRGYGGGRGMRAGYGRYRAYDVEGGFGVNGQTVRATGPRPPRGMPRRPTGPERPYGRTRARRYERW